MLSDSSGGSFLRRYRKVHATPPMLGYIHTYSYNCAPQFVATTSTASPPSLSSAMPPVAHYMPWEVLDCRHGHVLMYLAYSTSSMAFVIWDSIITSSARKHVVVLHGRNLRTLTAAMMCARDGCDHLDGHGGPLPLGPSF
ncbi:hypothetical protein U9M48_011518 [Paspalum notatum var. saurae]|uniref:Uncharacterized protein n=1 Tax=Paspalum notatum var. saurae TaxID=547442 RepID=A0AAQ3SWH4_PASNO